MRGTMILAALCAPSLATATASFQSFDLPGAATTCGAAIASSGLIAGSASISGSVTTLKPFVYNPTTQHFTFPKPAAAPGTVLFQGITRNRTILVSDLLSNPLGAAEYLYHFGTTTELTGIASNAAAINDAGTLIGTQDVVNLNTGFVGFLGYIRLATGTVTTLNDGSNYVQPTGLDAKSQRVVGLSGYGGFYFNGTTYTVIAAPGATIATWPRSVDTAGRVTGSYYTGTTDAPVAHGFIYHNGTYTAYNVPGATLTQINAANESGQVTGCYADSAGLHGFVAKP